jgi:NMD protein affecting ribosome stability and mRNA decay
MSGQRDINTVSICIGCGQPFRTIKNLTDMCFDCFLEWPLDDKLLEIK